MKTIPTCYICKHEVLCLGEYGVHACYFCEGTIYYCLKCKYNLLIGITLHGTSSQLLREIHERNIHSSIDIL